MAVMSVGERAIAKRTPRPWRALFLLEEVGRRIEPEAADSADEPR
jgi:hypothetical protein